jgi:hypothetical protein
LRKDLAAEDARIALREDELLAKLRPSVFIKAGIELRAQQ